jgi:hypothetical protein
VLIDFAPIDKGEMQMLEFSTRFTVTQIRDATHASLDHLLAIIGDADDAQVTHIPIDPNADDPFAPEAERHLGWSLAHLVAHVTASSEEWAAYGSILARGIVYPAEPRLRYEPDWKTLTTRASVLARLDDSRKIRIGYIDTMTDNPRLDVFRELTPRYVERFGQMNALAAVLFGMYHESGHYAQFHDGAHQARAARG